MSKSKVSVDVRVDPSDKASWQAEADAARVSVSELVRRRMKDAGAVAVATTTPASEPPELTRTHVNLDADEIQALRGWLDLADCDGNVDSELLESWQAYAAKSDISFPELLTRVVLYTNVAHL